MIYYVHIFLFRVLTFGSYEVYKNNLLEKFSNVKSIFLYATVAILGDMTGFGWLCPSEVVKQILQAGMYSSTGEAIKDIFKKERFGVFYEEFLGGLAQYVPFRVFQLTSYEVTNKIFLQMKKKKALQNKENTENLQLSPGEAATVGSVAGSFSAAITSPVDIIKTLLMTDIAAYGGNGANCAVKT